jgi:hypothetical protein
VGSGATEAAEVLEGEHRVRGSGERRDPALGLTRRAGVLVHHDRAGGDGADGKAQDGQLGRGRKTLAVGDWDEALDARGGGDWRGGSRGGGGGLRGEHESILGFEQFVRDGGLIGAVQALQDRLVEG